MDDQVKLVKVVGDWLASGLVEVPICLLLKLAKDRPQASQAILEALIEHGPVGTWLASPSVASGCHMSWLALGALRDLQAQGLATECGATSMLQQATLELNLAIQYIGTAIELCADKTLEEPNFTLEERWALHSILTDGPSKSSQTTNLHHSYDHAESNSQPAAASLAEHHRQAAQKILGAGSASSLTRLVTAQPFLVCVLQQNLERRQQLDPEKLSNLAAVNDAIQHIQLSIAHAALDHGNLPAALQRMQFLSVHVPASHDEALESLSSGQAEGEPSCSQSTNALLEAQRDQAAFLRRLVENLSGEQHAESYRRAIAAGLFTESLSLVELLQRVHDAELLERYPGGASDRLRESAAERTSEPAQGQGPESALQSTQGVSPDGTEENNVKVGELGSEIASTSGRPPIDRSEFKKWASGWTVHDDISETAYDPVLHHLARLKQEHVLGTAVTAALHCAAMGDWPGVRAVLANFPSLCLLVVALGWDAVPEGLPPEQVMQRRRELLALFRAFPCLSDRPSVAALQRLCNQLCYWLRVAEAVAEQKGPDGTSEGKAEAQALVLERLKEESAIRVLSDAAPGMSLESMMELINQQPEQVEGDLAGQQHDTELLHLATGLAAASNMLAAMAAERASVTSPGHAAPSTPLSALSRLQRHFAAISPGFHAAWLLSMVVLMLKMDLSSLEFDLKSEAPDDGDAKEVHRTETVLDKMGQIIDFLKTSLHGLPQIESSESNLEARVEATLSKPHEQAVQAFIIESEWRLDFLRKLTPSRVQDRQWRLAEVLTVLQAEPDTLLEMCAAHSQHALGTEVARHFDLPHTATAALRLAHWVDSEVAKMSASTGISASATPGANDEACELEFDSLDSPLSALQRVMLCLDVAATSALPAHACHHILAQAATLLKDAEQEVEGSEAPLRKDSIVLEACEAVLRGLQRLAQQFPERPLRDSVVGVDFLPIDEDEIPLGLDSVSVARKQLLAREKALVRLLEAEENARQGKHQFLSGLLHNLAKVLALEQALPDPLTRLQAAGFGPGLDLMPQQEASLQSAASSPIKDVDLSKPVSYLSAMLNYITQIGDELASIDPAPGEAHDYFALLEELPSKILPKLVMHWGCSAAAFNVAGLMGVDLVHEVIQACLDPIYPPGRQDGVRARPMDSQQGRSRRAAGCLRTLANEADGQQVEPARSSGTPEGRISDSTQQESHEPSAQPATAFQPLCPCNICALAAQYAQSAPPLPPGALPQGPLGKRPQRIERQRRPSRKKRVLLGVSAQGYTLRLAVLRELAASSPLRVALAGFMSLLQKHQGLTSGSMPVLPLPKEGEHKGLSDLSVVSSAAAGRVRPKEDQPSMSRPDRDEHSEQEISPSGHKAYLAETAEPSGRALQGAETPRASEASAQSSAARTEEVISGSPPAASPERPRSRRSSISTRPDLNAKASPGRSLAQDREMLGFVEQQAAKFPCLQRWVALQLATNTSLRDLQSRPGGSEGDGDARSPGEQLQDLVDAREWREAISLSQQGDEDKAPPDWLLAAAVEDVAASTSQGEVPPSMQDLSGVGQARDLAWEWCMQISDKAAAAELGLKHLRTWNLAQARQLLQTCSEHLGPSHQVQPRLLERLSILVAFKAALDHPTVQQTFRSWQGMDEQLDSDPVPLIRRLTAEGAAQAVRELVAIRAVPVQLVHKANAQAMAEQLTLSVGKGGGMISIVKQLKAMAAEDAAAAGLHLIDLVHSQQDRQTIIRVLQQSKDRVSEATRAQLQRAEQGLVALSKTEPPWHARLSGLARHPDLVLESLVMSQQFESARKLLNSLPSLHDDAMLLQYARRAVSFERWYEYVSPTPSSTPGSHSGVSSPRAGDLERASSVSSRRGATLHVTHTLTGDPAIDKHIRRQHTYRTAPSAIVVKEILTLASSHSAAVSLAHQVAGELMEGELAAPARALEKDHTEMERALEAVNIAVAILEQARQLMDAEQAHARSGHSSISEELVASVKVLHKKAQLLQVLLGSLVGASLADLASGTQVESLVTRLVEEERYALAVHVAKLWHLGERFVWEAWARSLILVGNYEDTESRLSNAFRAPPASGTPPAQLKTENASLALRFVDLLEQTTPASLAGLQEWVKQRLNNLLREDEQSLDIGDYLQVLRAPERLPTAQQAAYSTAFSGRRYELAEKLLRTYAPKRLLPFMFRHQHAAAACEALFPPAQNAAEENGKEPANGDEVQPDARLGDTDSLLRLAIRHGELRTLQRVLMAAGPRGRAALLNICARFRAGETFAPIDEEREPASTEPDGAISREDGGVAVSANYGRGTGSLLTEEMRCQFLYRCQLAMQLPDQAGLTSLRLAFLSPTLQVASLHLENAALHFKDALAFLQRSPASPYDKRTASMRVRMTPGQLTALSTRVVLQLDVHRLLQARTVPPKAYSRQPALAADECVPADVHLFSELEGGFVTGALHSDAAEAAAQQRRLEVAKSVLPIDFDLAFRIIYAFDMAAADVYAAAARGLAVIGDQAGVTRLLDNVQGTNTDQEYDQVVGAAAAGFMERSVGRATVQGSWKAPWRRASISPAQQLVRQMRSHHSQVVALLQMGLLEEAAATAIAARSEADVQQVAAHARRKAAVNVLTDCEEYLKKS